MNSDLRLLLVLAHPDDESLGNGGVIAKYAAEGVKTYLVTATRGERGWFSDPKEYPGADELGRIREGELHAAARTLGLDEVNFLDYYDGEFDQADHGEVVEKIVGHIRRIRPQVVITFDQNGLYGHPDHIAICRFTTAAIAAAADPAFVDDARQAAHHVSKLYYMVWTEKQVGLYHRAFGDLVMEVDGERRTSVAWPEWAVTTRIDTAEHWHVAWEAISCHRTQLPGYQKLLDLPEEAHLGLWGNHLYCRVFSRVPVRSKVEEDLFEGLRDTASSDRPGAPGSNSTRTGASSL